MQGIGVFSLLFWSLSLLFLKKFIDEKKISYLIINYLFIFSMFLTYESATPLLGISLFFPLLFKKYKIFIVNLIITLFIMSFIYYLQKYVFSEIFNIDLSRIKLSISDYKKILFLILVNSALTINILFQSLEIFLKSIIYNIATFNIMLFLHISLLVYFIFVVFKKIDFEDFKQKNFKSNYYKLILILMVLSVIFLNILMHVLADTGIEFIRYNNRALTSLSFITAFISLISFNIFNKVNKKKLIFINLIIFFIFVNNFLFFQHNLIKERYDAKYIVKKEYPKSKSILDTSKKI